MMTPRVTMLALTALILALTGAFAMAQQAERPEWVELIRDDHPRVFLNDDIWPEVRAMAEGPMAGHYERVKQQVDGVPDPVPVKDWGRHAMDAALVWKLTGDDSHLQRTREMLDRSVEFYHAQVAADNAVDWYSTSRIMALAAFDWIYEEMPEQWRQQWGRSMLDHIEDVLPGGVPNLGAGDRIPVNRSGITTGFYGTPSLMWYAGLAMVDEGIDDERALDYLVRGHDLYVGLLEHRRRAAGDDGGAASATLGYAMGAYPWAEFNFFHTWESATGENLAEQWPYVALFANYVMWNYLPGGHEFGYGDAPHTTNQMPAYNMPQHIAQMMHFYSEVRPDWVALMRYMNEEMFQGKYPSLTWGAHPFLLTRMDDAPPPMDPGDLPHARHFENMGQVFMRSGSGPEDTYALFGAGGILSQHRHYDNLNFWIYHRGFQTVDSGTRANEDEGDHLQNYYAQTVAHNCVLIDMPGEPVSNYWNGPVYVQEGGQYRQIGSTVEAFETNDAYTYVAGDGTEAYRPEKCEECTRQMVFVHPDHFVIFDRVRSTEPEYAKRWLLHTAREPVVKGATITADQGEGRLFCHTLVPEEPQLTPIGGEGRRFMAGGRNWPLPPGVEFTEMMGWGRVEVSAREPAAQQNFLHVIQVADLQREEMDPVELLEDEGRVGARIRAGQRTIEVTFATEGELAGHIRIAEGGETIADRDLATDVQPQEGLAAPGG
ncbi:MAG: heparinase II/III domain-containing protein [Armatimonadota bacterium]